MKLRAGRYVLDTDRARVLTELQGLRRFHKIHGGVHNFSWIFKEVFQLQWSKDLIKPRKRRRR